ncbi:hypothetical protein RJ640_007734 [Escallonia rubra]|uniref:C2 domain-containing protein n=1 Tax=Escallonia rubra TaxID=112253 RepID=A0AA88R2M2_9ASTE|nr:hypothetical protein RJ640_007734 [Escallonia rubra]
MVALYRLSTTWTLEKANPGFPGCGVGEGKRWKGGRPRGGDGEAEAEGREEGVAEAALGEKGRGEVGRRGRKGDGGGGGVPRGAQKKPVGILYVKVVQAHNLLNKDFLGTSDPYVKLGLRGERLPSKKTFP